MENDMLTQKHLKEKLSYDPDTGLFTRIKTNKITGHNQTGYQGISIECQIYLAHRLAFFYMLGRWPKQGYEIDHIDRNRKNNKWENLREVTRADNCKNVGMKSTNKSGVTGVSFDKWSGNWLARIMIDYKTIRLYSGKDKQEAIDARKAGEKLYGFTNG